MWFLRIDSNRHTSLFWVYERIIFFLIKNWVKEHLWTFDCFPNLSPEFPIGFCMLPLVSMSWRLRTLAPGIPSAWNSSFSFYPLITAHPSSLPLDLQKSPLVLEHHRLHSLCLELAIVWLSVPVCLVVCQKFWRWGYYKVQPHIWWQKQQQKESKILAELGSGQQGEDTQCKCLFREVLVILENKWCLWPLQAHFLWVDAWAGAHMCVWLHS